MWPNSIRNSMKNRYKKHARKKNTKIWKLIKKVIQKWNHNPSNITPKIDAKMVRHRIDSHMYVWYGKYVSKYPTGVLKSSKVIKSDETMTPFRLLYYILWSYGHMVPYVCMVSMVSIPSGFWSYGHMGIWDMVIWSYEQTSRRIILMVIWAYGKKTVLWHADPERSAD